MSPRVEFGTRLLAAIIDAVILIAMTVVLGLILGTGWLGSIISILAILAYGAQEIFLAATPGKKVMKIAIGGLNGLPASQDQLVKRYLLKQSGNLLRLVAVVVPVLFFFSWLGYVAGFAIFVGCFMALGQTRQALHDMLANTAIYSTAGLAATYGTTAQPSHPEEPSVQPFVAPPPPPPTA